MNDKSVIITGAAGFTGYVTTKAFSQKGYKVYAVLRPDSEHNYRVNDLENVIPIEIDIDDISRAREYVDDCPMSFIHLVWNGPRYDFSSQCRNVRWAINALDFAAEVGCKRFFCSGSQAEYGAITEIQIESLVPKPFCAYGAAKVSACYLTRYRARERGLEWIWGRIFSLYGTNEPDVRLMPNLVQSMKNNIPIKLSSCRQNWDYLHVRDGAEAIVALTERGRDGEIYNIANGDYRPLKEYIEEAKTVLNSDSRIIYGDDPDPFVSLQPSVDKIFNDTGWKPVIPFSEGIRMDFTVGS